MPSTRQAHAAAATLRGSACACANTVRASGSATPSTLDGKGCWMLTGLGNFRDETWCGAPRCRARQPGRHRRAPSAHQADHNPGRRLPRLDPISPNELALFRACLAGEYAIAGFTNAHITRRLHKRPPAAPAEARRSCQQTSRRIAKLRGHGLVAKIHPSSPSLSRHSLRPALHDGRPHPARRRLPGGLPARCLRFLPGRSTRHQACPRTLSRPGSSCEAML